jgi:hypothetical protein
MSHGAPPPTWVPITFVCLFPVWWLFIISMIEWTSPLTRIRARFPEIPLDLPPMKLSSARVGSTRYGGCIRIGLNEKGLFLRVIFPFSVKRPTTFVPLAEIRDAKPVRSFGNWVEFSVGDPAITQIRVPAAVFEGTPLAISRS